MTRNKKEDELRALDTSDFTIIRSDSEEKDKAIDFKQNVVNERHEVVMTIEPTYGVTYDKVDIASNKPNAVTN